MENLGLAQVPMAISPAPIWKRFLFAFGYFAIFIVVLQGVSAAGELGIASMSIPEAYEGHALNVIYVLSVVFALVFSWWTGRSRRWAVFRPEAQVPMRQRIATSIAFWMFLLLCLVLFIISLTPYFLGPFFSDIPPIDDTDLNLPALSIPDNQNAFTDLNRAAALIQQPTDYTKIDFILSGKVWDESVARETLSANGAALALFSAAAQKTAYQDPVTANPALFSPSTKLPTLGNIRMLAVLNSLAAVDQVRHGDAGTAQKTALNGAKLGYLIQKSQASILEALVGSAFENQSLDTMQLIIASSTSSNDLRELAASLSTLEPDVSGLVRATKVEYAGHKNAAESLLPSGRTTFYYHPNETIAIFATTARLDVAALKSSCASLKSPFDDVVPPAAWRLYLTPNAAGILLTDVTNISTAGSEGPLCREQQLLRATQLLSALKAYELEHGSLPDSLDALVPEYLPLLPIDPYTGKAFVYDKVRKILTSAGAPKAADANAGAALAIPIR